MSMTDQELFDRWIEGRDAEAFKQIVTRHSSMVYGTCVRILGNAVDAQDVAQECFEALARAQRASGKYLGAWLHRVATNLSLRRIRTETRRRDREVRFQSDTASATSVEWKDVYEYVDEAIAELSDKLRAPIVWHFLEDQTHEAIARTLGTSRQTVTYRIKKGIEQVRKSLRRSGIPVATTTLATMMAANLVEAAQIPTSLTATLGKLALAGTGKGVSSGTLIGAATLGGTLAMKKLVIGVAVVMCVCAAVIVLNKPDRLETPEMAVVSTEGEVVRDNVDAGLSVEREEDRPAPEPVEAMPGESAEASVSELGGTPVTGIVVDGDGQPVPGAGVGAMWNRTETVYRLANARSKSDGTFKLTVARDDSPDTVLLRAQTEGLGCLYKRFDLPAEGLRDVVITLQATSSIEGGVMDTAGNALAGARVEAAFVLDEAQSEIDPFNTTFPRATWTDSDGSFAFEGLGAGTYALTGVPSSYSSYRNPYQEYRITLSRGEHKQGIELVFGEGLSVWGQVTDGAGQPISGARVAVHETASLGISIRRKTSEDGSYSLEGFPDEEYTLVVSVYAEGYLREGRHGVTPNTEQNFVLQREPSIEGRVVSDDTGAPVTEFAVEAWSTPEDRASEDEWIEQKPFRNVVENEKGHFAVQVRAFGDITVAVKAPGFEVAREYVVGVQPGETIKDVVVRLSKGGSVIKGTVTNRAGEPLEGAEIFLGYPPPMIAQDGQGAFGPRKHKTLSGTDGSFEITAVSPHVQVVSAYRRGYAPGYTEVNIVPRGTTSVRIVLGKGGTLEGVVSLDGRPVGSGEASITPRFADGMGGQTTAETQSDGTYSVSGLMSGLTPVVCRLRKAAMSPGLRHWLQTEVHLENGEKAIVDFDFAVGYDAAVEGTVFFQGSPLPSTQVGASLELTDNTRAHWYTTTDANGYYRLEGVPSGVLEGLVRGSLPSGVWVERVFEHKLESGQVTRQDIEISN